MNPTPNTITALEPNQILVFGSNTQGRHGSGVAKLAVQFGAENGNPIGRQGQTYAIVTKDLTKPRAQQARSVPLSRIGQQIHQLCRYAKSHPDLEFLVTRIGCGLAGYSDAEVGKLWKDEVIPENVRLPQEFLNHSQLTTMKPPSANKITNDRLLSLGYERKAVGDTHYWYSHSERDTETYDEPQEVIVFDRKGRTWSVGCRNEEGECLEPYTPQAVREYAEAVTRPYQTQINPEADSTPLNSNPLKGLKPLNEQVAGPMQKDIAMAEVATQFIGRSAAPISTPSSTRNYEQAWGDRANTGHYASNDVVMVSGSGPWRGVTDTQIRRTFDQHYKPLLDAAIAAKAQIVVGDAKGTDQLVQFYLKQRGYEFRSENGFLRGTLPQLTQTTTASKLAPGSITLINQKQGKPSDGIPGDRGSVLGNPFDMQRQESQRDPVCDAYQEYFDAVIGGADPKTTAQTLAQNRKVALAAAWNPPSQSAFVQEMERLQSELEQGKPVKLMCWCAPDRCHLEAPKAYLESRVMAPRNPNRETHNSLVNLGFQRQETPQTYTYSHPNTEAQFQYDRKGKAWSEVGATELLTPTEVTQQASKDLEPTKSPKLAYIPSRRSKQAEL